MKKLVFLLLAVMLLTACGQAKENDQGAVYVNITAEEAKKIMDSQEGYIILDVRTREEYDEGHIPGATQISHEEITEKAEDVLSILSAFTTFIYQGLITLIFYFILNSLNASNMLFNSIVNHMSCTGSLLILVIGLNLMNITKIKTANLIPAMFMPIAIVPLFNLLSIL